MHIPISLTTAITVALVQGFLAAPSPQQQPEANSIRVSYTLRILGIPFGQLDYAAGLGAARYSAEMHFQTYGLAAVLWKAKIDAAAEGRARANALLPDFYTSHSLGRNGTQHSVRVDYTGNGSPVMKADPPYDLSDNPVTDAQKKGAVDPVTAISSIIAGLNTSDREPCGRTLAVFDGRRRYDIVFTFLHEVRSDTANINSHSRVCRAEYRHIAGLKQEVVDVSSVPAIYAEFVDVPAASRHYTVARTIWSSFMWGAVSAKLSDLHIDRRPVAIAP